MSFPRQFMEVPAGKIAAIVTSLEMFSAPAPRPERSDLALSLRRIAQPDLDWFRDLFRRTGEDWLWFSRLAMTDDALRAIIHDPAVEVYPLMVGEQEAGLLELDFRVAGECELSYFGLLPAFIGSGAGRWLMTARSRLPGRGRCGGSGNTPAPTITRTRSRSTFARDSAHSGVKSKSATTRG